MGEAKRRAQSGAPPSSAYRDAQSLRPGAEWAQLPDIGPDGETVIGSRDAKHHAPNRKQRRQAEYDRAHPGADDRRRRELGSVVAKMLART